MAVNSYNPRLGKFSTSSENDIDEVFLRNGVGPIPTAVDVVGLKNRCISDPSYTNVGKDLKKEEFRGINRASALSDSSNVVKRNVGISMGTHPKFSTDTKTEFSTISEEGINSLLVCAANNSCITGTGKSDNIFPEPEVSRREKVRDPHVFSMEGREEEDESVTGQLDSNGVVVVEELGTGTTNRHENETMFMQDMVFESRNVSSVSPQQRNSTDADDHVEDDDERYPEIERYPSGYSSLIYGQLFTFDSVSEKGTRKDDIAMTSVFSHDSTRITMSSYDADSFPDIPDDLMNSNGSYFTEYEFDMTPLTSTEFPDIPIPRIAHRKLVFGEEW